MNDIKRGQRFNNDGYRCTLVEVCKDSVLVYFDHADDENPDVYADVLDEMPDDEGLKGNLQVIPLDKFDTFVREETK